MAEDGISTRGAGAPLGTPGVGAAGNGGSVTGVSPVQPKSIQDIMALLPSSSQLTKDGEAYLNHIVEKVQTGREVQVIPVAGTNYEARVIVCGQFHVAFIFDETYTSGVPSLPTATMWDNIVKQLADKGVQAKSLICFVVSKDDYVKVDTMATTIASIFASADTPAFRDISIAQFNSPNFHVTDDLSMVKSVIEKLNPQVVAPRCDCGVMLYSTTKETNVFQTGQNGHQEAGIEPLLAVSAYTEFVRPIDQFTMAAPDKFVPVVTISGIWSKLPTLPMAILGICLAAHVLVRGGGWLKPFSNYGKGERNIGNLLKDPATGKIVHCNDQNDRNMALGKYTSNPLLAIDVQLGAMAIPGLRDLFGDQAALCKAIDNFSGGAGASTAAAQAFNAGGNIIQFQTIRFDGDVCIGAKNGQPVDTREIDYLGLVANGAQPDNVRQFLDVYQNRPDIQSNDLKTVYPDAKLKYVTYRAYLLPTWVDAITQDLGKGLKVTVDGGVAPVTFNMATLQAFQPIGYGAGGFVQTPYTQGFAGGWMM